MRRCWWMLLVFVVMVSHAVTAQAGTPWRSAYYPVDWTPASIENKTFEADAFIQDYSLVGYRQGKMPPIRPNARVFDVTDYGADETGKRDSTQAIQDAINAAQAVNDASNPGGIVYLPAGTYLVAPQGSNKEALRVSKSHVVLRGAGVGSTFIINTRTDMRQKRVIRVKPTSWASPYADVSPNIALASDVRTPTTTIALQTVNGLDVGQWIVVRNDITWSWVDEHNEPEWQSDAGRRQLRGLFYIRKIEAIDSTNNTIRINTPLRYYLKTRDNARVHPLSADVLQEVGLEHFSIGMNEQTNGGFAERDWNVIGTAGYHSHDTQMINIEQTRNSWIVNVQSFQPPANNRGVHMLSKGVLIRDSAYITLIGVVMKNTQYGGGGGNGYGFTLTNTQESLVLRGEAHFMRHGFSLSNPGASGNVFHACLDVDTGQAKGNGSGYRTSGRASDTHMHFTQSNLFDVCSSLRAGFEARYRPYGSIDHAFTSTHGVFWNTEGNDKALYVPALVWSQQARYGYVIGTRGGVNNVKISNGDHDARTAPLDIVEGEGMGADLQPFSLWLDQRAKRFQGQVTITGNAKQGETLSATVTDADGISGSITHQWYADGVAISGATGASHTLTQAEVGKKITVRTIYTDDGGNNENVLSDETGTVANVNDVGFVTITGNAKQGETLSATVTDADGISGSITHQWYADGVAISGATGASHTLTQAEVGKKITVRAVYTDDGGKSENLLSAATSAVMAAPNDTGDFERGFADGFEARP